MYRLRNLVLRERILYVRQCLLEMQTQTPFWVTLVRAIGPSWLWFIFLVCLLSLCVHYLNTGAEWTFALLCALTINYCLEYDQIKRVVCLPPLEALVSLSETLLPHPKFKDLQKLRHYMHEWLLLYRSSSDLILRNAERPTPDTTRLRQLHKYK